MLTEINGNIDATYPIITGELTGYLGPIGTVTASADNSVGTPHVIVTQTPTPDGLDIDFAFKEMGIPGLDLTVEQDLTEEQQQTARENIDAQEALTFDAAPTQGSQNPVTSGGVYNSVADINAKIPAAASAQNKLADKEYVDDSINRTSAFFRGNFATYADLMAVAWQTTDPDAANYVSNNDYAFVAADETHSGESWRYIYVLEEGGQDNGWAAQYRVNESPLTPEQLAALNSGITSQGVSQIETNRQGLASHVSNTSNPHQVTKAQVGLGNVDNTSDANKPVSTAQQAALDAKQDAISSTASVNSDKTPYLYRRAGGGVTIGNRAYSKLIGATIANNQLADDSSVPASSTYNGITFTFSNHVLTVNNTATGTAFGTDVSVSLVKDHIYLKSGLGNDEYSSSSMQIYTDSAEAYYAKVFKATTTENGVMRPRIASGQTLTNAKTNYQLCDLTQDFGSTIADYAYTLETQTAGSGVAWLKSYGFFGKYAPYDAGSLISTKAEKKKVTGKNLLNPATVFNGYRIDASGQLFADGGFFTSDWIKVEPSSTYCKNYAIELSAPIALYDGNKSFISRITSGSYVTTTADTGYIRVTFRNANVSAQIEKGTTATAYTPYTSQEYDLGSDELRGLFKLDNGNLYADGDIKTPDGQITRNWTILNLGTLDWYEYSAGIFVTSSATEKKTGNYNLLCEKYVVTSATTIGNMADKEIKGAADSGNIIIKDTSYAGQVATFKSSLADVSCLVELATPTTEQGTPYQDPQEVFADGTEEYIDSRTVPVPVGHETDYPGITYLVSKLGNETAFTPFASDVPPAPAADGTYVLQVSVSSGTPFYRWVSAAELVGE